MYSNKENVNIITALLVRHGVHHAVVCPGSRNAPIVHNLNECPDIDCLPVTDERSAAFYALGMAQTLCEPVAVCVTSGSALLNVLPAVAEAYYQHLSLIVISADRPAAWIGQLDGQTLQQSGALDPWVAKSVTLPEVGSATTAGSQEQHDAGETRWYCNRLVNEALLEATSAHHPCVHINVPISEPLFEFTVAELPDERVIRRYTPSTDYDCLCPALVDDFLSAKRPMVVFGQMHPQSFSREAADFLFSHVIVLHEALASFPSVCLADKVLAAEGTADGGSVPPPPDFVLYVGGAIVSKRLKKYLRKATDARVWRVSLTGEVEDTFQNLRGIVVGDAEFVLQSLSNKLAKYATFGGAGSNIATPGCAARYGGMAYRREWLHALNEANRKLALMQLGYSQMAVVKEFEKCLEETVSGGRYNVFVHYANSSAVRLANMFAHHHVYCNRGVNGIEGSLSTAAGFSVSCRKALSPGASGNSHPAITFCVIGDLSFFYDQNALWNQNLSGNLRILLLNNGKGGIFETLPGLRKSAASDSMVSGRHHTTAEGICHECNVAYMAASDMPRVGEGLRWLMTDGDRPKLLEVFTNAEDDTRMMNTYYNL